MRQHVVAVLVCHDGEPWLPRALEALSRQTRRPDLVVAVDTGSRDATGALVRDALGTEHVVEAPRDTGFGDAVRLGVAHADALAGARVDDAWLWVLHDDCAPDPRALELLLDTGTSSPSAGVVGPKLVAWDDPHRLLEAGLTVSRAGRRSTFLDGVERDQGQHDHRSDVLAVSSAGLLARREVWDRLGGFDPALKLLRDDVDLCWRAHLAGHRVLLAPRAVVADAQAATRGRRAVDAVPGALARVDRQHGQHVALARCSLLALPWLLVRLTLVGVARALLLLAAKSPRRAAEEVGALAVTLLLPWRWLGSRWRSRGHRVVAPRSLSSLLTPRFAAVRHAVDVLGGWAARDDEQADGAEPGSGAVESGPVADEAQPVVVASTGLARRVLRHPLTAVTLALLAATAVAWRHLLGGLLSSTALSGGELRGGLADAGALWHAGIDPVRGAGLGTDTLASPAGLLRAAGTWLLGPVAGDAAAAAAVTSLLLLAPLLAGWSAYLAAGSVTRSRWARGWAALAWGGAPVLLTAVAGGRLGPVLAAVLLPLTAAALARALTRRASGALTAAFAATLGVAVLTAVTPAIGGVAVAISLAGLVLARGAARLRALVVAVLSVALLGPWVRDLLAHPRLLLAGPGAVDDPQRPLALPGGLHAPAAWTQLVAVPHDWPHWVAGLWLLPLVLLAALALARGGRRGRAVTALGWVAVAGLALAALAPSVVLDPAGTPLVGWAGTGALVALLALVAAPLVAADGLQHRLARHGFGWRQLLLAPVVLLAVLAPVAAMAVGAWQGVHPLRQDVATGLPAVAADAATGPHEARTLVLASVDGHLTYRLDGGEPGPASRDVVAPVPAADDAPVRTAATQLADPGSGQSGSDVVAALHRLAVRFVLVRRPVNAALADHLDATAGLSRIGSSFEGQLWRVGDGAAARSARVRIERPDGRVLAAVPASGPHAAVDTVITAGPAARVLVLAEARTPLRHAELDGRALRALTLTGPDSWRQAYALPAQGGHLVVRTDDPSTDWWRWAQLGLLALVVLLALPVRRPSGELR